MRRTAVLPEIAVLILCLSPMRSDCQALPDGDFFGQSSPGTSPQVFMPGVVSLPDRRETKLVCSPDGLECFAGIGTGSSFTLLYSRQENGHWSDLMAPDFIGQQNAREPFVSVDGKRLLFVRNADIWESVKTASQWSAPHMLGEPVNSTAEEWHPTVTSKGIIYFCSSRDGPSGGFNIWRTKDSSGSSVERLDSTINSLEGAWDPFVASDESYTIFSSSGRKNSYGEVDQYISYRSSDGSWSEPKNLGSDINSKGIQYGSLVTSDGKYYFFSRPAGWGPGIPADIYWVNTESFGLKK